MERGGAHALEGDLRVITGEIKINAGLNARVRALAQDASARLASDVLSGCEPFVPMDTGALVSSGRALEQAVVYAAEYASDVYYSDGRKFSKERHPDASARWLTPAKAAWLEKWRKAAQQMFDAGMDSGKGGQH